MPNITSPCLCNHPEAIFSGNFETGIWSLEYTNKRINKCNLYQQLYRLFINSIYVSGGTESRNKNINFQVYYPKSVFSAHISHFSSTSCKQNIRAKHRQKNYSIACTKHRKINCHEARASLTHSGFFVDHKAMRRNIAFHTSEIVVASPTITGAFDAYILKVGRSLFLSSLRRIANYPRLNVFCK